MPDKLFGTYEIRSVVLEDEAATGVTLHKPTYEPVRVGADVRIWDITPNEDGTYYLSVRDKYPYTGVLKDEKRQVIATIEEQDNRKWRIVHRHELDAYTIELDTPIWPSSAWTLSAREPGAEIVLGHFEIHPTKDQLFKLLAVDA